MTKHVSLNKALTAISCMRRHTPSTVRSTVRGASEGRHEPAVWMLFTDRPYWEVNLERWFRQRHILLVTLQFRKHATHAPQEKLLLAYDTRARQVGTDVRVNEFSRHRFADWHKTPGSVMAAVRKDHAGKSITVGMLKRMLAHVDA